MTQMQARSLAAPGRIAIPREAAGGIPVLDGSPYGTHVADAMCDPATGVRFGGLFAPLAVAQAGLTLAQTFLAVSKGGIVVGHEGVETVVGPGAAVHCAPSLDLTIRYAAGTEILVGSCEIPREAGQAGVVFIDSALPYERLTPTPKEMLVEGEPPEQRGRTPVAVGRHWRISVWSSTSYHRKTIAFPKHEAMLLLEGGAELTPSAGDPFGFGAGDMVHVPGGWVADWHTRDTIRKVSCTYNL